jgi:ribosomal protein S18 acetylase RimI-like enzyme
MPAASFPGISPDTRIRPATTADSRAIAEVHVRCWEETYDGLLPRAVIGRQSVDDRETQWRRTLERDPRLSDVFVVERDGAVIGFVASGPRRGDGLKQDAEIYALYLLRAHQRRGVGRALCRAAALRLRERGMRSAAAWVLRENGPARRFYEAIGGETVNERTLTEAGATMVEIAYGWDELDALTR